MILDCLYSHCVALLHVTAYRYGFMCRAVFDLFVHKNAKQKCDHILTWSLWGVAKSFRQSYDDTDDSLQNQAKVATSLDFSVALDFKI